MAAVKRLPVHHHCADFIFLSFGIIEFIFSHLKIRVPLKPVLGGVAGVAHYITGHEQTQLNRVCYFHFFDVVIASKGSNLTKLCHIFIAYKMLSLSFSTKFV